MALTQRTHMTNGGQETPVAPSRLATDVYSDEFARHFRRFADLIGPDTWIRRSELILGDIRGNHFLRDYLSKENRIALALLELHLHSQQHGTLPVPLVRSEGHYEACAFITLFLSIYGRTEPAAQRQLLRRTASALDNPDDLRALQFEWLLATHLTKRGFILEFPELCGTGTIDLVASKDDVATEIECKSISHRKGRQIHRRDALEMHAVISREVTPYIRNLNVGLAVRVIVPNRLPRRAAQRVELSRQIRHSILSGGAINPADVEVRVQQFKLDGTPLVGETLDEGKIRTYVKEQFGIDNKEVMLFGTRHKCKAIISLESARPDRMLPYTFDAIADACDRQLSSERPGVICVKLEDVTAEELAEIGSESGDPTALRRASSRFIESRRRSHLVCLSFFSDGPLVFRNGAVSRQGRSYFFDNPDSPHHNATSVQAFMEFGESSPTGQR